MLKNNRAAMTYIPYGFLAVALIVVPILYSLQLVKIETINLWGRFAAYAIVALGIDLVWGYTGILSLCQAMFFSFGAYAMGLYIALHGRLVGDGIPECLNFVSSDVGGFQMPWFWKPFKYFPFAVMLGMALPGMIAAVFGFFAFRSRVRGVYFSIITQATTLAFFMLFCLNSIRMGGTNGLSSLTLVDNLSLTEHSVQLWLYIISFAVLGAVFFLCSFLVKSRLGRILVAIRDNESRLRFSGYKTTSFKVFVFALAAMLAGLGGMLFVSQEHSITPDKMGVELSIMMVVWVAFGGRGTLTGAIFGALAVNFMYNQLTSSLPKSWPFVQGALFIGVVLFFPEGLIGLWRKLTADRDTHFKARPSLPPIAGSEEEAGIEQVKA